ncbi:MAG: aldehyde dehydrogenase family protein, partial [Actinobacteria bacterium]|nr:aldehyde dehydrogenase family protein [Actinomycetota bacterium]
MPAKKDAPESIPQVVNRLRRYFESGATRSSAWREEQLSALITMLEREEKEILAALAQDIRKCTFEGHLSEIFSVKNEAEEARDEVSGWMKPE